MSQSRPILSRDALPKLVTVLNEGYGASALRADLLAGLTVAIVALPLSMAIAIASGVGPEKGVITAIVGGVLVSALGGSRHQIGGPAGAFIVLVSACVADTGVAGLVTATFLSGALLMAMGLARLGSYIRYIPYPVTVGFTAAIALIIFASQLHDLLGLTLMGAEPSGIVEKLPVLWAARDSISPAAIGLSVAVVGMIVGLRRWVPRAPNLLVAVAVAGLATAVMGLPVETISSRFGELPRALPLPQLPVLSGEALMRALPWAAQFALLGAIESLLSALVADGMTGRRHRSNVELVAQGVANMGVALFGGFCVTGTIARTATNVRAGSRGPISGIAHSVFLALFMLVAAPLAGHIPLAALAGVLVIVAWNMVEKEAFVALLRTSRGEAMVLLATFLTVALRDLTEGIILGFALGGLVFIRRMSETAAIDADVEETIPVRSPEGFVVYRLHGPYFFGAAARLEHVLEAIADRPEGFVLDFSDVPFVDASGARSLAQLAGRAHRRGRVLYGIGLRPEVQRTLEQAGLGAPAMQFRRDLTSLVANPVSPSLG